MTQVVSFRTTSKPRAVGILSVSRSEKAKARPSSRSVSPEETVRKDFKRALRLFNDAALRVPAYRDFLKKAKINPDSVKTRSDFGQVPLVDKPNYISKYSLEQLSWDGTLKDANHISSSSGSTGTPFYWPRRNSDDAVTGQIFQYIYEDILGTKNGTTLFINMFALGTWLAGLQFYDGAKRVADLGNEIVIVTPGIEKTTAVEAIKRLALSFDRVVLAGYPPFIKDVLEFGSKSGIEWKDMDVKLLTAGESFSEIWRTHMLRIIGKENSPSDIVNVYGMAEAGVVAHETPLSIATRRAVSEIPEIGALLTHYGEVSPLYQYDSSIRYFEVADDDSLVLTTDAGLPLVRYNTRDRGGLLPRTKILELVDRRLERSVAGRHASFPFVYLFGRRDLSISLYALNIYVENVKQALETSRHASSFSGLFTMCVKNTREMNQRFEITVELARGASLDSVHAPGLEKHTADVLCKVNSEYSKLYSTLGRRVAPKILTVSHGKIETVPGRKHKWVKRI